MKPLNQNSKPEPEGSLHPFYIIVGIAVLLAILFGLPSVASAGTAIEDILKFRERMDSGKKEVVCSTLHLELADILKRKQVALETLRSGLSKEATIDETYRLLSLVKVQEVLEEQLSLNACGGKK